MQTRVTKLIRQPPVGGGGLRFSEKLRAIKVYRLRNKLPRSLVYGKGDCAETIDAIIMCAQIFKTLGFAKSFDHFISMCRRLAMGQARM